DPAPAERHVVDVSAVDVGLVGLAVDPDIQARRGDRVADRLVAAPDLHALHGVECVAPGSLAHGSAVPFVKLRPGWRGRGPRDLPRARTRAAGPPPRAVVLP